ncbi:MAG: hypothetical protein JJU06_15625 [Ectothiorhodospiraceae bacterium]|nr:hypothetical protein [Ectothiorhodospiraceae bacterium]
MEWMPMLHTDRCLPLVLSLFLLAGCGADEPEPQGPLTWSEWVEQERPKREAHVERYPGNNAYFREGLPDMSLWRPEDFLSEEELNAESVTFCELPIEERREYLAARSQTTQEALDIIRGHAERGLVDAQFSLGFMCHEPAYEGLTLEESHRWSRRAAASGEAIGISARAYCLQTQRWLPDAPRAYEFETDEMLYWHWRAAQNLESNALRYLGGLYGFALLSYYDREQVIKHPELLGHYQELDERYKLKWSILADLSFVLLRGDLDNQQAVGFHHRQRAGRRGMTAAQLKEALRLAREFLLAYPEGLENFEREINCDDDPERPYRPLHYNALNAELAHLGLYLDPAEKELQVLGPIPMPSDPSDAPPGLVDGFRDAVDDSD